MTSIRAQVIHEFKHLSQIVAISLRVKEQQLRRPIKNHWGRRLQLLIADTFERPALSDASLAFHSTLIASPAGLFHRMKISFIRSSTPRVHNDYLD
jgi:hypothetical protein